MTIQKAQKVTKPVKKKAVVSKKEPGENPIKPEPPKTSHAYKYDADPKTNRKYWLIKSEPVTRIEPKTGQDVKFPLSDLVGKEELEPWDGVRNYEARNNMLVMQKGDVALFYHSNCENPGIVGEVFIENEAHIDETQFDSKHKAYDAKSTRKQPKWWCVDVKFKRRFRRKISLAEMKNRANELEDFLLLTRGRLSVIPVGFKLYTKLVAMENEGEVEDDLDCTISRELIK